MPGAAFRGWWIVAVAFVAQGISIGLTIIPYGLFATPVTRDFDASVGEFQTGLGVFTLMMTAAGSLVGRWLDRGSIRAIMAGGSALLAIAFAGLSFATELWQLALGFGLVAALGVATAGPLAATTVIAKWFDRKRGRAVGLAALGIPASAIVLTPLAGGWIAELGWRTTLQIFAGISLVIAPLALIIVRDTPEALGQYMDGEAPRDEGSSQDEASAAAGGGLPWSAGDILRSRDFWLLALGVGIVFGGSGGWNANVPRYGEDLGYSGERMAALIGMAGGLGAPATLLFGWLADRCDNRRLLAIGIGGQALALGLLWTAPPDALFTAAILLFGFAGGGLMPVYASLIGRLFGPLSFGSVMGLAGLVMLPFGAGSPIVAGAMRDLLGSYAVALLTFTVAFAVGALLLLLVRRPGSAAGAGAAHP